MKRTLLPALFLLAACRTAPEPEPEFSASERELIRMHDEIWNLMGLSDRAGKELNSIVIRLKRNIEHNVSKRPELANQIPGSMPSQSPTKKLFVENHLNRFKLLGISSDTKAELLGAMEWVWDALHNEAAPESRKARAEKIRELMVPALPPCQDDRIFERSKRD